MNKGQRQYAVTRATVYISDRYEAKYPAEINIPSEREIIEGIGCVYKSDFYTDSVAEYIMENHPIYDTLKSQIKEREDIVNRLDKEKNEEIQNAEDFIMLGDNTEVLSFLESLK